MSKIPERAMFLHPSMYSSDKFRVKHVITKPAAQPGTRKYFTAGDLTTFNLGAAPNQLIIPETAFMCFTTKTYANTILDSGVANPWTTASGGYKGDTPFGLPRPDFGLPFWDQVNINVDSSRNLVNMNGAALCRSVLNGRLACASMSMNPDFNDVTTDHDLLPIDCYNSTGPASLCGFVSNSARVNSWSGPFRNEQNTATYAERFGVNNGSLNYKVPLSLFTGLLDSYASSWLPLGMLSQSSASGLSIQVRWAKKEDVLVNSAPKSGIKPSRGPQIAYPVIKSENTQANDGTVRNSAYTNADTANTVSKFFPDIDPAADEAGIRTYVALLTKYLKERAAVEVYPDGRGADLTGSEYAIFEPVIVYRVVEILDENLLNLLRASFNGQNVENIELVPGQVISIPKLLNIKYRGYNYTSQVYPAGMSSVSFTIPMTEPSFRGVMIRLAAQEDEGVARDYSKSPDPGAVITKFQIKIGTAVYPLTPIEQVNNGSLLSEALVQVPPLDPGKITISDLTQSYLNSSDSAAYAQLAGLQEDARALFSPWYDVDTSDNMEEFSFLQVALAGNLHRKDKDGLIKRLRPLIITFDNHTNYEKEKLDNAATGIDMRGIGSYTLELSLRELDAAALKNTVKNYNVFITDCYDAVMSVKRNAIDPNYQFAIY